MKRNRSHILLSLSAVLCILAGCGAEGALDRFGERIMESLDTTPMPLAEVNNPRTPPPGMPCSDSLDYPMRPVTTPSAAYPEHLRKKSVQGKATVFFIVDSTGAVVEPSVTYATDTAFAQSVLAAVKTWKIEPCEIDGKPVSCYKKITIDFALQ
jgi:TonB family protein